jgi:transcriptional regulator with GAF, ATPase, and Fis domain
MPKGKNNIKTDELQYANQVTQTLYNIANAVNTTSSLEDLYFLIHQSMDRVMDVTNFFIAILNRKEKKLFFPYYRDIEDDDFAPITDFDANNSLTGLVVLKEIPLLLKREELLQRASQNGVWGPVPVIWMGVPLKVRGEITGVVAVQSYTDPECYTEKDLDLLASVSDQIAVAIDRRQADERLYKSEKRADASNTSFQAVT